MADAAARREARRRRILENSELRLQRITGQSNNTNSDGLPEETEKNSQKVEIPSTSKINGNIPTESLIDSWNLSSEFEEDFSPTEENIFSSNLLETQTNIPRRRNFVHTPNGEAQGHIHNDNEFNRETSNSFVGYGDKNLRNNEKIKSSILINFFSSRWIYLILAIIVNILIAMKSEYLFGTSIIVPFAVILVSRKFLCTELQENQGGSMLFAALLLCNIRPNVIHRFRAFSALFSCIFREFSFYLFNFVLIYYFFTSNWCDFDDLTINKAKVIVNHNSEI